MNPRELLENALRTLRSPHRWTQHATARNPEGRLVGVTSTQACAWDVYGAVYRQTPTGHVATAVIDLLDELTGGDVIRWNDDPERRHADVVELLNRAAATYDVEASIWTEEPTRLDMAHSVDIARAYELAWRGQ